MNGIALNSLRKYKDAILAFDTGLDFLVDDFKMEAEFMEQLGLSYKGLGQNKKASEYYNKAVDLRKNKNQMFKNSLIIIFFLLLISSCKSTKTTTGKISDLSAKNIIKKNDKVSFDRSTIKASLSIKYKGKSDLPSLNGSMRMIKDSVIWISLSKLGFPIAKLMITPK